MLGSFQVAWAPMSIRNRRTSRATKVNTGRSATIQVRPVTPRGVQNLSLRSP